MIPVDLNRLREALYWLDIAQTAGDLPKQEEIHTTIDAADAVLDAPTVWWCASAMLGYTRPNSIDCDGSYNNHDLCGWVALVPVKGSPDGT